MIQHPSLPQYAALSLVLEPWELKVPGILCVCMWPEGRGAPSLTLGNITASGALAPFLPEPPPESLQEVRPSFFLIMA